MKDKEISFLIKLTEDLYRKIGFSSVNLHEVDLSRFIKLASENNLLFLGAQRISAAFVLSNGTQQRFQKIIHDGEKSIVKLKRALDEIKSHIPNGLFIKTFRGEMYLRIPTDVDVLTNNFDKDISTFRELGYRTDAYLPKEGSIHLLKDDVWKIHLHSKISWAWEEFIDPDIIYQDPRVEVFHGYEIYVPNVTADVLIHLAHMNFEPLHITLGELLYLFNIIPKMDFDLALEQARKYRWGKTFQRTLKLINRFHYHFYGETLSPKIEFKEKETAQLIFPYSFPRTHLMLTALEKRLFIYPLTRLMKVINILSRGDTFTKYIFPSDQEA